MTSTMVRELVNYAARARPASVVVRRDDGQCSLLEGGTKGDKILDNLLGMYNQQRISEHTEMKRGPEYIAASSSQNLVAGHVHRYRDRLPQQSPRAHPQ